MRSADEAAIHALYQQLMDGWNKGSEKTLPLHLQIMVI
jgi:hypothetical protein